MDRRGGTSGRLLPLHPFARCSVRRAQCSPGCAKTSESWRPNSQDLSMMRIYGNGSPNAVVRAAVLHARRGLRAAVVAEEGAAGESTGANALAQLPKQFKASNVRQVRELKDKRPSEIFAAITRWIEAGLAKRKARGLYKKT
jgi:hypothetical protein